VLGGAFASSATRHGSQKTTLFNIINNLLHFGMTVVGLNFGLAG
jgi:NAD(P)H dehydrogenase (quinone)